MALRLLTRRLKELWHRLQMAAPLNVLTGLGVTKLRVATIPCTVLLPKLTCRNALLLPWLNAILLKTNGLRRTGHLAPEKPKHSWQRRKLQQLVLAPR